VSNLEDLSWVPQKNEEQFQFREPCNAVAEKLPDGFDYQTGYKWLKAIKFGKSIEEQKEKERQALEQETDSYREKESAAKNLGFDSLEEAEEIAKLYKQCPEVFEKIKAQRERPDFPSKPIANPERRSLTVKKQIRESEDKKYE